jgi:drug/metabolite transporter (DMT)-like permease
MDSAGAAGLIVFSIILALNQVVIKTTADGFAPLFQAGMRSLLAFFVIVGWVWWRRISFQVSGAAAFWGVIAGVLFAAEFLCLFIALDLSTVSRSSIIFYAMPLWLSLAAHFLLPGEQLTKAKIAGMALAFCGVVFALAERKTVGHLGGDFLALMASLGWAAIVLVLRMTPLSTVRPELQLGFQLAVSAPILLGLAIISGPLLRDVQWVHLGGLAFQVIFVASFGFLFWFRLMQIYRAASVASFSFLSPVLAVLFGWVFLNEQIGAQVWVSLVMVAAGLVLINRR